MDYNKVFISGEIVREPEIFSTLNNRLILKFNLQVKDKKHFNFFNAILYGELAEKFKKNLKKGDKVFIEGKLRYTKYTTKVGAVKSKIEIIVENMHIIEKGGKINDNKSTAITTASD